MSAWQSLFEFYDDAEAQVQAYMDELGMHPAIERASTLRVHRLRQHLVFMVDQLEALELPLVAWSMPIMYMARRKLSDDIQTMYDSRFSIQNVRTLLEFLEEYERELISQESSHAARAANACWDVRPMQAQVACTSDKKAVTGQEVMKGRPCTANQAGGAAGGDLREAPNRAERKEQKSKVPEACQPLVRATRLDMLGRRDVRAGESAKPVQPGTRMVHMADDGQTTREASDPVAEARHDEREQSISTRDNRLRQAQSAVGRYVSQAELDQAIDTVYGVTRSQDANALVRGSDVRASRPSVGQPMADNERAVAVVRSAKERVVDPEPRRATVPTVDELRRLRCPQCRKFHSLYKCPGFLALSVDERDKRVSEWKLCRNCLHGGHVTGSCYMRTCFNCPRGSRHNSVLCRASPASTPRKVAQGPTVAQSSSEIAVGAAMPRVADAQQAVPPRENPFRVRREPTGAERTASTNSSVPTAGTSAGHEPAKRSVQSPILSIVQKVRSKEACASTATVRSNTENMSDVEMSDESVGSPNVTQPTINTMPAMLNKNSSGSGVVKKGAGADSLLQQETKRLAMTHEPERASDKLSTNGAIIQAHVVDSRIELSKPEAPQCVAQSESVEMTKQGEAMSDTIGSLSQVPPSETATEQKPAGDEAPLPERVSSEEISMERENELLRDNDEDALMIHDDVVIEVDRMSHPGMVSDRPRITIRPMIIDSVPPEELFSDALADVDIPSEGLQGRREALPSPIEQCNVTRTSSSKSE